MATLELIGLEKSFGATPVLRGIDLDLPEGEMLVIIGASGCGKSTLLRIVAGLEQPSAGRVVLDGRDITGLDPSARDIAVVFQNYALYPHMTVFDNLACGLRIRGLPRRHPPASRADGGAAGPRRAARPQAAHALQWGSASALPWGGPSCASPSSSRSTSHCPTWTPSCGSPCAPR